MSMKMGWEKNKVTIEGTKKMVPGRKGYREGRPYIWNQKPRQVVVV